jgi:hypothetical protein
MQSDDLGGGALSHRVHRAGYHIKVVVWDDNGWWEYLVHPDCERLES